MGYLFLMWINLFIADLIMKTCTKDGLLLKTDKPSTAIDSTFLPQAGFPFPSIIQVWDSFTAFGPNRYIL